MAEIEGALAEPLLAAVRIKGKLESYAQMKKVKDEYVASIPEDQPEKKAAFAAVYDGLREKLLKREIFEHGHRLDGRRFDEVRPITCEVGVLPRTHGSALFTRGETQALVTATLGTSEDSQIIDTVQEAEYRKRFMLHYNFPPFSVGEVKFLRGPGRREIGHGALAERSLREMLPAEEGFPYTIRIVSDILESNGSSSMATVCGGTLALMDAGVPIKSPVAGVAMGLVMDGERLPGPHRHRRRGRPLRRHGLQGRRHPRRHHRAADGHQGRRPHARDHGAARSSRPAWAGCTSSTGCSRPSPSRARTSARTRRASSRSASRSTRSATSSGRAAR